jgi:hypothetical protein
MNVAKFDLAHVIAMLKSEFGDLPANDIDDARLVKFTDRRNTQIASEKRVGFNFILIYNVSPVECSK